MEKSYVDIILEENEKGNGVVFHGIILKLGINGLSAQCVLNTMILKAVKLGKYEFYYPKEELVKDSVFLTKSKIESGLKKLEKAGFISIEKKSGKNFYILHKDVIENAIGHD